MAFTLTSPYLQLTLNPETATWSLHSPRPNAPSIEDAWMQVSYRSKRNHFHALQNWQGAKFQGPQEIPSSHGNLQQITLTLGPDKNGLCYKIEYALPTEFPLFLWRLTLENQGEQPFEIEQIKLLQAGFFPKRRWLPSPGVLSNRYREKPANWGTIRPHPDPGKLAFYSNGWQSWSFTGTLGSDESHPDTRLGFLGAPMWFNRGTPRHRKPGHFSSDMFGILGDRQHRSGILAGFLSQKQHFGSLEAHTDPVYPALALWANGDQAYLEPGTQITTDWAAIQFVDIDSPEPVEPYLEAVAREHLPPRKRGRTEGGVSGWCSWYQFYQDISEEKIRANLQSAVEIKDNLPFDLFQIDDGFQAQIGDWLEFDPDFPNGVAPLAEDIQEAGFTPGLWLAPFIVHSKAKLNRQHPDWFLRNRFGLKVNAGFVWYNFNKALDLTHPEALNYIKEVVHTAVHDWGYKFLKLDFLFAAALSGRFHDRTKTRAQVLRMGLEALREAAGPDVHLLGCGVPLGPSIGILDSMRIGADVAPDWPPALLGIKAPFRNEPAIPATRNAIQNTLTRAFLHRRWWVNDPDCLLVRPDSNLNLDEVHSLATVIALTGGTLLLSDDLPKLPVERLRIAQQLVPLIGQRPQVMDWFDTVTPHLLRLDLENVTGKWHLLAIFNWADEKQDLSVPLEKFNLPAGDYFAREFWRGDTTRISDGLLTLESIPAHGVRLLALRPAPIEQASYLGSDLHISQGLEVTEWSETPPNFRLRLERPGSASGQIDLHLPKEPRRIILNQKEIIYQPLGEGVYRLPVDFEQVAEIEIV